MCERRGGGESKSPRELMGVAPTHKIMQVVEAKEIMLQKVRTHTGVSVATVETCNRPTPCGLTQEPSWTLSAPRNSWQLKLFNPNKLTVRTFS